MKTLIKQLGHSLMFYDTYCQSLITDSNIKVGRLTIYINNVWIYNHPYRNNL